MAGTRECPGHSGCVRVVSPPGKQAISWTGTVHALGRGSGKSDTGKWMSRHGNAMTDLTPVRDEEILFSVGKPFWAAGWAERFPEAIEEGTVQESPRSEQFR
jgi:hypothetical protein